MRQMQENLGENSLPLQMCLNCSRDLELLGKQKSIKYTIRHVVQVRCF